MNEDKGLMDAFILGGLVAGKGNGGDNMKTVEVSGTTPTIDAEDNTVYKCGELTSLTLDTYPATGEFIIVFESGSTPTTTSFPNTIKGLESFAAEANKIYEISIWDGRALTASW